MSHTDVAVVGGGAWGRALAAAAARSGASVMLVSRREADPLDGVRSARELPLAARARLLVLAVPSDHAVTIARELGAHLDGSHFLVHGIRGLIGPGLSTVSHALRREIPTRRVGALGGPVLAAELVSGSPSVMVVGSRFREVNEVVRDAFAHPSLRLYSTTDLIGLEWASALTGCLAIALGYALGSGAGPGIVAAFTTRAVHEAARIAVAAGGEQATLLGLAGLGDLLASVAQDGRPEVVLGRRLAQGGTLADSRAEAGERIEALELLPTLVAWTKTAGVRAPIISAMAEALFHGLPRADVIAKLMSAPLIADET